MHVSAEQDFNAGRSTDETVARAFEFADLSSYSFKERFLIRAADLAFYFLINLTCKTLRWEVTGWEHVDALDREDKLPIYAFWHNRIFLGTYGFRRRGYVVMTSQSFDGEYIARFIQRFGYGAARGSSTRGAVGALVEMARLMRAGHGAGFTIDGPKGPRYVAKMGALLLAKKTGHPVLPVRFSSPHWEAKGSWDGFQVPIPFSRARIEVATPIYVPADTDEAGLQAKRDELQAALDKLTQ